jgi:hypothetical protein
MDDISANAAVIERELAWLSRAIEQRLTLHFKDASGPRELPPPPGLGGAHGPYTRVALDLRLDAPARLLLALAFAPHIKPQALDPFLMLNPNTGRRFTEFGGWTAERAGGFWPTVDTALFLLAGDAVEERIRMRSLFARDHALDSSGVLRLEIQDAGASAGSARLLLPRDAVRMLLGDGGVSHEDLSARAAG